MPGSSPNFLAGTLIQHVVRAYAIVSDVSLTYIASTDDPSTLVSILRMRDGKLTKRIALSALAKPDQIDSFVEACLLAADLARKAAISRSAS